MINRIETTGFFKASRPNRSIPKENHSELPDAAALISSFSVADLASDMVTKLFLDIADYPEIVALKHPHQFDLDHRNSRNQLREQL